MRHCWILVAVLVAVFLASAPWAMGQAADPTSDVPLWQLNPFDRLEVGKSAGSAQTYDVEPIRLKEGKTFTVEADAYVGEKGLPHPKDIKRNVRYRIKLVDDGGDFYVHGRFIRKISFYEDLLLAEAKKLITARKFDGAFDYLTALVKRDANWPGVLPVRIDFHRHEGERFALSGDWEKAFWAFAEEKTLRDLFKPTPAIPRLDDGGVRPIQERIEQTASRWIAGAQIDHRHADIRRIVSRLEAIYPTSAVASRARADLKKNATAAIEEGKREEAAERPRQALAAFDRAVSILPDDPEVRLAKTRFSQRYPVLRVVTGGMPSFRVGPSGWTRWDRRASELIHLRVLRLSNLQSEGSFESQVVSALEKSNVNKRATVTLMTNLVWPGDGKPVTSTDLQRLLADSCQPSSPLYHPALARLVVNLSSKYPDTLVIDFDRPQPQPAAWLQIPFLRIGYDASLADLGGGNRTGASGLGPFRFAEMGAEQSVYLANQRFLQKGKPLLAQVTETRKLASADRLRALEDGSADLATPIPPRHYKRVAEIPGVTLVKQSIPHVHVIQFNMNRRELRSRALRRAIDYAINRAAIFDAVGLKIDKENHPITAPFPSESFGYNAEVKARPYDLNLASALMVGVKRELQTVPPLRLLHSGDETSRTACEMIVKYLQSIGLQMTLIEQEEAQSGNPLDADLRYQSYEVSDPIHDLVTVLTRDNPTLAQQGSPWFRRLLVDLIEVPNLSSASRLLPELHRVLHEDAAILPLWQWRDHFAVAKTVSGLGDSPPTVYHHVEQWKVIPTFPDAGWETADARGSTP